MRNEATSKRVAKIAARALRGEPLTPAEIKALAGSALTQVESNGTHPDTARLNAIIRLRLNIEPKYPDYKTWQVWGTGTDETEKSLRRAIDKAIKAK